MLRKYDPKKDFYRNFRVKVYGNGYNTLAGLRLLARLFDPILFDKILQKAYFMRVDKLTIKFRRGIRVTIYQR